MLIKQIALARCGGGYGNELMYKVEVTISVKLLLGNAKDNTEKTDCTGFVETIRYPSEMMKI